MSTRNTLRALQGLGGIDQPPKVKLVRDLSGGQNTRLNGNLISETSAVLLQNIDITTPGQRTMRPGLTLLEEISAEVTAQGRALGRLEPNGETNDLYAVYASGATLVDTLSVWTSSGDFTPLSGSFTSGTISLGDTVLMKQAYDATDGDILVYSDKTTAPKKILSDSTISTVTLMPRTNVFEFYNNRLWALLNNRLYWSDAVNVDGWDLTNNNYFMPVGAEKFVIGTRELGLIVGGDQQIYRVLPSNSPEATDTIQKLVDQGCVANKSAAAVGEDILYLARDGVRGVFRTFNDKLQYRESKPLSWPLKDRLAIVNWQDINKASAIYYDNKYFLSLPVNSSDTNNEVWVYYPEFNSWTVIVGWSIADFSTMRVNGQEFLYAIASDSAKVWRAWSGTTDDGSNIVFKEEGRFEDMGSPLELKTGGEVHAKVKSTTEQTFTFSVSFDEGSFNKVGEIITEDRTVNFANWTLPFNFQDAGTYTERFHLDEYGQWYTAQIKAECTGNGGNDSKILETALVAYVDPYLTEENK